MCVAVDGVEEVDVANMRLLRRGRRAYLSMAIVLMVLGVLMFWAAGWFSPAY